MNWYLTIVTILNNCVFIIQNYEFISHNCDFKMPNYDYILQCDFISHNFLLYLNATLNLTIVILYL